MITAIASGVPTPYSWILQESPITRCEHQDDSNIHCQPFPESVSEEHEIYTHYDGCHRRRVKHVSDLSAHFIPWLNRNSNQAQERILGRTPGVKASEDGFAVRGYSVRPGLGPGLGPSSTQGTDQDRMGHAK